MRMNTVGQFANAVRSPALSCLNADRFEQAALTTQGCEGNSASLQDINALGGRRRTRKFFVLIVALFVFLNSCAAILDGNVVTRDGKQTPFTPMRDIYSPPRDPGAIP